METLHLNEIPTPALAPGGDKTDLLFLNDKEYIIPVYITTLSWIAVNTKCKIVAFCLAYVYCALLRQSSVL